MRLLLVSDVHYRLPQLDWLIAAARDKSLALDVIAIAGDLLDIRSAVPLDAQAIAVTAQLKALGGAITVLSASGNHDLDGRDANGEKAAGWLSQVRSQHVHVDGESLLLDDTLFTVCPWWDGPLGRASLGDRLAADAARAKRRWVWVHHAPPLGSPLAWDGRRDFGDEALTAWIAEHRPDVVLTGHIHQAPFVPGGDWAQRIGPTWLFNAGSMHGPVPAHVVLDLVAGTASWTSSEDRREVLLNTG
jgi:Icc-related predicted phosphoesterase